jgi:uncharacterized membrane protein
MIWFCALLGVIAGFAFESFPLGMLFVFLGCIFGWMIRRDRKKIEAALATLKQQVNALEQQNSGFAKLIAQLEQRLMQVGSRTDESREEQQEAHAEPAPSSATDLTAPEQQLATDLLMQADAPASAIVKPTDAATVAPTSNEPEMEEIAALAASLNTSAEQTVPASAPPSPPRPVKPPAKPVPRQPSALELKLKQLIFGGNPLLKIGVLILFLGLAFLLRYASEYIVVPVEWRYAGVAATGVALLVFGWRLRHKQDNYGLILQGTGIGVMYLTPLAAMRFSGLLPPQMGFVFLIAIAVFAALLAILQDSFAMAVVGTLGGFAAPILVSTGKDAHLALFAFLTLLNLGIAAIAWFKAWRVLNLIGFSGTFIIALGWAHKFYQASLFAETEPFLLLYFGLYVLITFLFARRVLMQNPDADADKFGDRMRHAVAQLNYVDGVLTFGVPFIAFAMQYEIVRPFAFGAAFSAMGFGLFYSVLALTLFRSGGRRYQLLTETLLALAVIFGSLAIPLGLDQAWTAAAWAVEAAGLYWLGLRQQRPHGRAFAFFILAVSALAAFGTMHPNDTSPAVLGSSLGCALLAASGAAICAMMRRTAANLSATETSMRPIVMTIGALFLFLLPLTLTSLQWGCAAIAVIGVAAMALALRWEEKLLQAFAWLYQAAAGAMFISTLHAAQDSSAIGSGGSGNISGLFLVSLIGTSMLVSVWLAVRAFISRTGVAQGQAPRFGPVISIALLAGLILVNLAPLFVLSLGYAALIWSLSGLAILWWALRVTHLGAIVLGTLLQAIAGIAHLSARFLVPIYVPYDIATHKPFAHSGFLGPILISIASLLCARLLAKAQTQNARANRLLGSISLTWSVIWWAFTWSAEITRVCTPEHISPALVGITVATAALWIVLARRWNWQQLGAATLLYLPALIVIAFDAQLSELPHPLTSWGILAWPLALAMHGLLLKQQTRWFAADSRFAQAAHVIGTWFFIFIAAWELRWHFASFGEPSSAWPLLGWMLAPVATLFALSFKRVQQSWPIREQHDAYLLIAALPVALYLLAWVWISNIVSNGNAAPLPYVTLLNPLELAHAAVLLSIALWWLPQRQHPALRAVQTPAIAVIMATALAMLTGIVARSCHHWGGVEWDADAMWQSTAFQTAISIAWSIVAICTMLAGNKRRQRWVWISGAALMGAVVVKLFLVELAAHGSLARIVSFIVVGLLLLVVGYFAPLPPRRAKENPDQPADGIPSITENKVL